MGHVVLRQVNTLPWPASKWKSEFDGHWPETSGIILRYEMIESDSANQLRLVCCVHGAESNMYLDGMICFKVHYRFGLAVQQVNTHRITDNVDTGWSNNQVNMNRIIVDTGWSNNVKDFIKDYGSGHVCVAESQLRFLIGFL
ncbi:hypothetical protein RJT34_03401 [Clitoria ternatea]|uniref:Uncharacterized protein n=1 Tax=Clitoria ternatea TaxID=43366 RepID=A0AAN9PZS7_CLITE